jgi:fibronectin type 3 domain-containing protein
VDTTPPAAPTGVVATGGSMGISLTWNANTEPDLAGYNIYRSSSASGTFVKLNSNPLTSPKFFDTTVPAGATVYYRIVAVDKAGNASAATLVSAVRPTT